MRQIKIAQIGVGNWGKNLLRNFHNNPQVQVTAVCELNDRICDQVRQEHRDIKVTSRIEDLYDESDVDAIVIATQPSTHYQLAREFILRGKHIFVEKPMVLELTHGEELVQLARKKNKVLMVGHILEYHPAFIKLHELVNNGELGEVYYIYCTRVNLGVVRDYENSLWSFAPHDISIILMLMGEEPVRVVSTGQAYLRPGIEDVVFTTLHFPGKKMAHIHVSWLDPHKIRKLTVVGSKKMAVIDDMESSEKMRIYDKGVSFSGDYLTYGEALSLRIGDIQIPFIKMEEPLKIECQHFVDCILENKNPKSDGADGLRVVRVLNAAERSLKQGGVPVNLQDLE